VSALSVILARNEDSILVSAVEPFFQDKRLWSFADMIECKAIFLVQAVEQLASITHSLYRCPDLRAEMRADAKMNIAASAAWEWLEWGGLAASDADLNFRIIGIRSGLAGNNPYSAEAVIHILEGIRNQLISVISQHKFALIPQNLHQYFEQEQLFGGVVYEFFPEARNDIKNAGNALSASLFDACVFHLMRASEYGLRSLARKLRLKLSHRGKPQPLDTATWDKVIAGIRAKLQSAHSMHHTPARSIKIRFYADLAERCSFVKDIWRNDVMHTRTSYGIHDALGAFERVKGFMQLLCEI
jgi:hypothetical protein